MTVLKDTTFGVVAIGRNEGDRLKQCLSSLSGAAVVVYVDSGSTDGSVQWVRSNSNFEVIELDEKIPFTAARARNKGFLRLRQLNPELRYVQFVDGDCELISGWAEIAMAFLSSHVNVAAVCGRVRERFPERSVFNWLCDREWDRPAGEVRACGGNVMMRADALSTVGGYRDDLIAGEEPELCVRLRAVDWKVWQLDKDMTVHDAAMHHFKQWWRRMVRSGYAFAQGTYLHGAAPEYHFVWESRRAWLWGLLIPLLCLAAIIFFGAWGATTFLVYPIQLVRQVARNSGSLGDRVTLALFQMLARFAETWGQIRFLRDRVTGGQNTQLVQYE